MFVHCVFLNVYLATNCPVACCMYNLQEWKEKQASEERLEKKKEDLLREQEKELKKTKEEFEKCKLKLKEKNDELVRVFSVVHCFM